MPCVLRVLFLDCGSRDEFNLHLGARMLHESWRGTACPTSTGSSTTATCTISYRYEASIPALGRALP